MDEQLFTVIITVFSGLCLIIGFFISFLLYQILGSQNSLQEKFVTVLSRLECLTVECRNQQKQIDMVVEEVSTKCDKDLCPMLMKRCTP
jgi:hypothetical protein